MLGQTWYDGIMHCQQSGKPYVMLTVMGSVGSTPRDMGSKMLVTEDRCFDTIGGGHLEFEAIKKARSLLVDKSPSQHIEHYPLAAKLAQCCGGATHILFEVLNTQVNRLMLFGAGHVAQALVPIIANLPMQIDWIDSRALMFAEVATFSNVRQHVLEEPQTALSEISQGEQVLIMTHDHQLDFELTRVSLAHPVTRYVGLIGSETKARRFLTRLQHMRTPAAQLAKLRCPVGLSAVPGKLPIEVAVSIAAQIIQQNHQLHPELQQQPRESWQQTKHIAALL